MINGVHKHINIMEELVTDEVSRQLKNLPKNFVKYRDFINPVEVETYALNHLPPLYASSISGKSYQLEKGKAELKEQIKATVTRAIGSVLRDPLRKTEPLLESIEIITLTDSEKEKLEQIEKAINNLKAYLQEHNLIRDEEEITADNLSTVIRSSLRQVTLPMDEVLQELEEYLFKRNLIGINCQLHLGNLVEVIRLVVSNLSYNSERKKASTPKPAEKMSDLEFYLAMKDELEAQEEDENVTEPMSKFGLSIRDNLSGRIMSPKNRR